MPSHPIENEIRGDWRSIVELYILASLWAPLTEELMFRGAFFSHLRRRHGWLISAGIVSIIFAVIHPQGLVGVPAIFAIGLTLAAIREWRGSILASRRFNNSLRAPAATMSDASEGPTSREGTPRLREGLSEGLLEDRRCFSLTPPTLWRKKGVSQCGRGHPTHEISHLS